MSDYEHLRKVFAPAELLDAQPKTAFEHVLQQRVSDLAAQIDLLQKQTWALLGSVGAAIIVTLLKW
jgi:hypothetical protein